jgi:hypothetical protein
VGAWGALGRATSPFGFTGGCLLPSDSILSTYVPFCSGKKATRKNCGYPVQAQTTPPWHVTHTHAHGGCGQCAGSASVVQETGGVARAGSASRGAPRVDWRDAAPGHGLNGASDDGRGGSAGIGGIWAMGGPNARGLAGCGARPGECGSANLGLRGVMGPARGVTRTAGSRLGGRPVFLSGTELGRPVPGGSDTLLGLRGHRMGRCHHGACLAES